MDAIVYTSNTGSAKQYANWLAEEMNLPVYSLAEAKRRIANGAEIIYAGWIMASGIKGYADAAKRYSIRAVCAVGMGKTGTQVDVIRKKNNIPERIPLFTLQGNFDVQKLRGMYRLSMEVMVKTAGKSLAAKQDRTAEEEDMLDMMLHGGERARRENIKAVLDWYQKEREEG